MTGTDQRKAAKSAPAWPAAAVVPLAMASLIAASPKAAAGSVDVGDDLITTTAASRMPAEQTNEGIRAGNYFIRPSVAAFSAYDDNIFATSSDRQSDVRSVLNPSLEFKSELPRHVLDFSLDGRIVNYAEHSEQNYENIQAKLKSALHFDHAHTLSFSASSALEHAELGAITIPSSAAEPIAILRNRASIGITRDAGRLYGTLSGAFERADYSDVDAANRGSVDEDYRDIDKYSAQAFAGYRFSPGYEVLGKIRTTRQKGISSGGGLNDLSGYDILGGIAFETGPKLRWNLLAGYGFRDFDDDTREDVTTSLFDAELVWTPAQGTSFTAGLSRSISDSLDEDGESGVATSAYGGVTYALTHNLTASALIKYSLADYTGSDQSDTTWTANLGLDYAISDKWSVGLGYQHQTRDSETTPGESTSSMTRNRIMVGAKIKF